MSNTKYNLCCLFHSKSLVSYRTITFASFLRDKSADRVIEIWSHNLDTLYNTIQYCVKRNWGLRVSSSIMPLFTHPDCEWLQSHTFKLEHQFKALKTLIQSTGIRLSSHPSQYNVLESLDEVVVANTVKELNWHGWLFDQLGLPRNYWAPINLHIHTSKGDFYDLAGRFLRGFNQLDDSVKSRLTVENNDKGDNGLGTTPWHCENLLEFHNLAIKYNNSHIALCYDNLHDSLLRSPNLSSQQCFEQFYDTWQGIIPIFHHSESREPGSKAHADLPTFVPFNYGKDVHWDIELKFKEQAISALEKIQ